MGWSTEEYPVGFIGLSEEFGGGVSEPHYLAAMVAACTRQSCSYGQQRASLSAHVVISKECLNNDDQAVHEVWTFKWLSGPSLDVPPVTQKPGGPPLIGT
ncbi:hypothetical protein N7445_001744 [Penicillium cf. griseofulvum]|nr:hypothetical protein N7445_001744 [Penicillium cf. griseofulvum]